MRALSVRQPWVWSIFHIGKDVENRDWSTRVRGRVAIHASKTMTRDDYEGCLATCHHISRIWPFPPDLALPRRADLTFGALIGTVEIVDCVASSTSPWFFGEFGFVLREPRLFQQPIPWRGSLGFFNVPDDALPQAV